MKEKIASIALLSALHFFAISTNAHAEDVGMELYVPSKVVKISDNAIYKVSFKCAPEGDLKSLPRDVWFVDTNKSLIHSIILSKELPIINSEGKVSAGSVGNIISFFPVFDVSGGSIRIDNRLACPGPYYISGKDAVFLQAVASSSTNYAPGLVLKAAYAALSLVSPLYQMFNGNISGVTKEQMSGASDTQKPLIDLFSALNSMNNTPITVRLSVGKYKIKTKFSTIDMDLKYVPSLYEESSESRSYIRKMIDSSSVKLGSVGSISDNCIAIASDLLALGFSAAKDVPYALAYKGLRSQLSADQASKECLGPDYALNASRLKIDLWNFAGRKSQIVTEEQAQGDHPPGPPYQPSYSETKMYDFNKALGRVGRADTPGAADLKELASFFKGDVEIVDKTELKMLGGLDGSLSVESLVDRLRQNGFRRFGCNEATSVAQALDGGKTALLAFGTEKAEMEWPKENIMLMKPIFTGGKITKLTFYDQEEWIYGILSERYWRCGKLHVSSTIKLEKSKSAAQDDQKAKEGSE